MAFKAQKGLFFIHSHNVGQTLYSVYETDKFRLFFFIRLIYSNFVSGQKSHNEEYN